MSSRKDHDQRSRVFRTGFRKYLVVAVPAASLAALMIIAGARYYETARYDPASAFLYVVPWAMAAFILVVTLGVYVMNAGKRITVTPQRLEYTNFGKGFKCPWGDLVFTAPAADKIYFKTAVIGDGSHFERLEEFFLPEFGTLVELIKAAKKHSREQRMTLDVDV